jgi:hypothetical protein
MAQNDKRIHSADKLQAVNLATGWRTCSLQSPVCVNGPGKCNQLMRELADFRQGLCAAGGMYRDGYA